MNSKRFTSAVLALLAAPIAQAAAQSVPSQNACYVRAVPSKEASRSLRTYDDLHKEITTWVAAGSTGPMDQLARQAVSDLNRTIKYIPQSLAENRWLLSMSERPESRQRYADMVAFEEKQNETFANKPPVTIVATCADSINDALAAYRKTGEVNFVPTPVGRAEWGDGNYQYKPDSAMPR